MHATAPFCHVNRTRIHLARIYRVGAKLSLLSLFLFGRVQRPGGGVSVREMWMQAAPTGLMPVAASLTAGSSGTGHEDVPALAPTSLRLTGAPAPRQARIMLAKTGTKNHSTGRALGAGGAQPRIPHQTPTSETCNGAGTTTSATKKLDCVEEGALEKKKREADSCQHHLCIHWLMQRVGEGQRSSAGEGWERRTHPARASHPPLCPPSAIDKPVPRAAPSLLHHHHLPRHGR